MKTTNTVLCLVAVAVLATGSASAQAVPELSNCSFWTAATEPVSLMNYPDGTGTPLTDALTMGSGTSDATITVELLDALGAPVADYQPCALQIGIASPSGDFITCVIGASPDGPTDSNGHCTFTGPIAAGGYDDSGTVVVLLAGQMIPSPPLDIVFNSPDLNADLGVNVSDTALFTTIFTSGIYDYRIDYNFDGVINVADQADFMAGLGTVCSIPEPPDSALSSASMTVFPGHVSLYNHPDGTGQALTSAQLDDGSIVDATITVQLLDAFGSPVVGYPAECLTLDVEFGLGNFVTCPGGVPADGPTDPLGYTTFSGTLPAGGNSEDDFVIVKAAGVPISGSLDLWFNSPDLDADLDVDEDDETLFMDDFFTGFNYRSDFNFDGLINIADTAIFTHAYYPDNICQGNGTVIVNPDPDFLNAGWQLTGPLGFDIAGTGDATFTDLAPGDYYLDWAEVECWTRPSDTTEHLILPANGSISFDGLYIEAGTIIVDAEPPAITPTWRLTGPASFSYDGTGDETLTCLAAGQYTLEWFPVAGWILSCPDPVTMLLEPGGSLEFTCTYGEAGLVVINPDPNLLNAPWHLAGPGGYETSGNGDVSTTWVPVGEYTLTWGDVPYWVEPVPNPAIQVMTPGQVIEFDGLYETLPEILSIVDVDNDQGRRVRITWRRCLFDAPEDPVISAYGIFRRQDEYKGPLVVKGGIPRDSDGKLDGWDALGMVPARMDDSYHYVAETLCDSTIADGDCYSTFMISAITPDPGVFFDSRPDSGYSVDNLAPNVPQNFVVAYDSENVLTWEGGDDVDFRYFKIYAGGPFGYPTDSDTLLHTTTGLIWQDPQSFPTRHYRISAVDFSGNESTPVLPDMVISGVDDTAPRQFALHHNAPNPFNPTTVIAYDLPQPSAVRLVIYDASGRRVRVLVQEPNQAAGRHKAVWHGRDQNEAKVAAGVYFYHLEAQNFSATGRMVLLK